MELPMSNLQAIVDELRGRSATRSVYPAGYQERNMTKVMGVFEQRLAQLVRARAQRDEAKRSMQRQDDISVRPLKKRVLVK